MLNRSALIVAVFLAAGAAPSAEVEPARTVTVVPGARYQAGWLRRLLLGAHWRKAWNTPVEVPVLDLSTFHGGLLPERQGGGLETTNLRLESADGRAWSFRSVDKDPTRILDPDTRRGLIGGFAQDMTSAYFPCGALVVAPLLEAAGVFHTTPELVVMPDDPRLGEYRRTFAGMLGLMEERIEHRLPGVEKEEETLFLFERLDGRSDEHVDARDYLRARLIDILVGDWDRHVGQFRWVLLHQGQGRVWRVVPRDRDAAFSRFDGALPSLVEYYGKQVTGWGTTYPPIDKVTFAARYMDRRFLVGLEWPEWETVTAQLVPKLTDAVISEAVHRLPPAMHAEVGADLERALRSRRDLLTEVSREYYRLLANDVDVRGTSRSEDFEVRRHASGATEVSIYAREESTGERGSTPFFHRTFLPGETSEIRLYTMGGGDHVIVEGAANRAITLRVISPPGTDEVVDRISDPSATAIYAPVPPPQAPAQALQPWAKPDPLASERRKYETTRDWGRDSLFFPQFGYDSNRGLVLGMILQRTTYGFDLEPYASQMKFGAAWSTGTNQPRLEYGADFRTRSPLRGLFYLAYSGMDVVEFFGFGNETPRNSSLASNGFYDVRQPQVTVNPMLERPLFGPLRGRIGALFKHVSSVEDNGFIGAARPYGSGGLTLGSGEVGLALDTRTGTLTSLRGFTLEVSGRHTPTIFSNEASFSKLRGAASAAFGAHVLTDVLFSARVAGERNWGRYPFFESAFLGGTAYSSSLDLTGTSSGNLLRGYDLNRFAGDASVVANTEIDLALGRYSAILPLRYGVFGLCDFGRVFLAGESSSKWHTGSGGGIWLGLSTLAPYALAASLRAAVVKSEEGTSFYVFSGFGL